MKTRNSLSKKMIAITCLLLFTWINLSLAQNKYISKSTQQKANNNNQVIIPQCLPPSYIHIMPQSSTQLDLEWEDMGSVIGYIVDLYINGVYIDTYYSSVPDTSINIPLHHNDKIQVCIRTRCTKKSTSVRFCKLATNLTAVATVDPVYLVNIDNPGWPGIGTTISDCPMVNFDNIASRNNSDITSESIPCSDFSDFVEKYNKFAIYRTQDICNPPSGLSFAINPSISAEQNCMAFARFLEDLTAPTSAGGGGLTLSVSTADGITTDCQFSGKTASNPLEIIAPPIITPNPAQDHCLMQYELAEKSSVTLSIFDTLGKKVWEEKTVQSKGKQSLNIDISHLPEGILYYTLSTNEIQQQGKFIKVK